ncbi:hypothetical protein SAMD00019534_090540 [Acytostelium subglobosum LB1]|uniref:hypothetical protein n=1 Tax=Acytostelium subglobosum LB1 TaxID=1410327 RepID=UPI000644BB53|nr:hypothetical protein SAMD00019534_090540 [Acytostelium subglobosum LB1]GAM25879.1 hypothetical protein SAMD00019534_090540 [Acytostelium subglobosum LB1]|eukprot:XP_012750922.1 hypothetical protein SAMD00019534_090540 [Acytostelium subglobosum LB1]
MLKHLNDQLFAKSMIILPVYPSFHVLGIVHEEAICLNSRDRVPFMLYLEVKVMDGTYFFTDTTEDISKVINTPDTDDELEVKVIAKHDTSDLQANSKLLNTIFGENWKTKENKIWRTSPYRSISGWRLISFIVKSGDDLRQEQLAMQLITQFYRIFKKTNLPLWLRPYLVVATGQDSGLIETIPDSTSLDTLKKKCPNYTTLLNYFIDAYGDNRSKEFILAQSNFIESVAGYALVCYFLQIKDRHNGNILIDRKGHIIHIDYGFLLSTSPGAINFEKAPFKLTEEIVELMGGEKSDRFKYFTVLLLSGFLQVRNHYQEFMMMIELMIPHTNLKCLKREGVLDSFRARFRLDLRTEEQCSEFINQMVNDNFILSPNQ